MATDAASHVITYQKLSPLSGVNTVTLTTGGGEVTEFEFPNVNGFGMLLSKDFLRFTLNSTHALAAGGAAITAGGATKNGWVMWCNVLSMMDRIALRSRTGRYIFDVPRVDMYTAIVWLPNTSKDSLLAYPRYDWWQRNASLAEFSQSTNRAIPFAEGVLISDPHTTRRGYRLQRSGLTVASALTVARVANNDYVSIIAHQATTVGGANGGAIGAVQTMNFKLAMNRITHTIYEQDQVLMFNEALVLTIYWGPYTRIGYVSALSSAAGLRAQSTQTLLSHSISDLYYYHAIENNPVINAVARQRLDEGYSIIVESPNYYSTTLSGTNQVINMRYNRDIGKKIRRIYASIASTSTSGGVTYLLNNKSEGVTSFYNSFMGNRISQYSMTVSAYDDYMLIEDALKGSAIQDAHGFYTNWFNYHTFENKQRKIFERVPMGESEGYDLTNGDITFQMNYTTSNYTYNHFVYTITERVLNVTRNGIEIN